MPTLLNDVIVGIFHRWTHTGFECHASGADCNNCPIYRIFKMRKDDPSPQRRCYQPEANASLLEKGMQPPNSSADIKDEKAQVASTKRDVPGAYATFGQGRILEAVGEKLREEIVRLIPTLKKANVANLIKALNKQTFLDASWDYSMLANHLARMRKYGVVGYTVPPGPKRSGVYCVLDASKLEELKRKGSGEITLYRRKKKGD